jgi:hypothetical protein
LTIEVTFKRRAAPRSAGRVNYSYRSPTSPLTR